MKQLFGAGLCAALLFTSLSLPAAAASPLTAERAKTLAEACVPSGSAYLSTEDDDGRYEVKFYHETNQERYEVDVSKATRAVVSFESEKRGHRGGASVKITEEDAKKAVAAEIEQAEILSVYLDYDDGYSVYTVRFQAETCYGEYDLHTETGAVLERDVKVGSRPTSADTDGVLTYAKVVELAGEQAPGAAVTDVDLEYEDGVLIYEVEAYLDGYEYDLAFDAKTGELLWNSSHRDDDWPDDDYPSPPSAPAPSSGGSGNYIGAEQAKRIALDNAPAGCTVRKCEFDFDDGRALYEVELRSGRWEYEFEIDAETGAILESDQDYDD